MNAIQLTRQAIRGVSQTRKAANNPFNFVIDTLIRVIVKAIIPVPLASELIIYFKGPILALLLGSVLFFLTFLFIVVSVLFPQASSASPLGNLAQPVSNIQNIQEIQKLVNGYSEAGFGDTDIPTRDPFGGSGTQNQTITVNYHNVENFTFNGAGVTETEQGIDIIPSSNYYATNKAYKLTGQPIIFDTLTGVTHTYVDQYGANIVEVTNADESYKTVYIHMSQILVGNDVIVHPGQPIGIMGTTGMSTGPHLEYQVQQNQGGNWVTQDPLDYIN